MMKVNAVIIEASLYVLTAAVVVLAVAVWKKNAEQKECPAMESVIK